MSEKHKAKLLSSVKQYSKISDKQKALNKETNAAKTDLRNVLVEFLRDNELPVGTQIRIGSLLLGYAPTVSETVDPKKWYEMLLNGTINEDQFLSAISVGKADANRIIGHDQVLHISAKSVGKKADIRISEYDKPYAEDYEVIRPKAANIRRPVKINPDKFRIRRKIKIGIKNA